MSAEFECLLFGRCPKKLIVELQSCASFVFNAFDQPCSFGGSSLLLAVALVPHNQSNPAPSAALSIYFMQGHRRVVPISQALIARFVL